MIRFKSCFKKKKVGRDGDQASLAVSLIQFLTGQDGLKYIVVTRGWIILATRDLVVITALSPWCAKRLLSLIPKLESDSSVLDSRLNVFDGQERESTCLYWRIVEVVWVQGRQSSFYWRTVGGVWHIDR